MAKKSVARSARQPSPEKSPQTYPLTAFEASTAVIELSELFAFFEDPERARLAHRAIRLVRDGNAWKPFRDHIEETEALAKQKFGFSAYQPGPVVDKGKTESLAPIAPSKETAPAPATSHSKNVIILDAEQCDRWEALVKQLDAIVEILEPVAEGTGYTKTLSRQTVTELLKPFEKAFDDLFFEAAEQRLAWRAAQ